MRIETSRNCNHLKPAQINRSQGFFKRLQIHFSTTICWQRKINSITFSERAGSRVIWRLMQRNVKDFLVTFKNLLSPVAEVSVNIQNQGSFAQLFNSYRNVVEIAKPTRVNAQSSAISADMMSWRTHKRKTVNS